MANDPEFIGKERVLALTVANMFAGSDVSFFLGGGGISTIYLLVTLTELGTDDGHHTSRNFLLPAEEPTMHGKASGRDIGAK